MIFLISANQTCFLFQKYKKIVFSLYFPKQVFENRKQKLLPNITLIFLIFSYISNKNDINFFFLNDLLTNVLRILVNFYLLHFHSLYLFLHFIEYKLPRLDS